MSKNTTQITKSQLIQMIKEEYSKVVKKRELTKKLNAINEEISKLGGVDEVHAGEEMHGGYFEGQHKAEFDKKGSALTEDNLDETNDFGKNLRIDGDAIKFIDHRVGTVRNGKPEIDPAYAAMINPEAVNAIMQLQGNQNANAAKIGVPMEVSECDEPGEEAEIKKDALYEPVTAGGKQDEEDVDGAASESGKPYMFEERQVAKGKLENNIQEQKNRMLRLSGLI